MGDKRTGACAAGDGLKDWRFNFSVSSIVQHLAQRFDHLGTLQKRFLNALVDDEVNVALAVAEFRVVKRIVCHAVFFLNDGQRLDAFCQNGQFLGVDGNLASLCAEHEALDADEISQVKQFLENRVVEFLVFRGADVVARHVNLDAAARVEQFCKAGLAHDASAHHTAGDAHFTRSFCVIVKVFFDFR